MLRSCISEYKISKVVIVRSYPLTLIYRLIQFIILLYGFLYIIVYNKNYQTFSRSIKSLVTFTVKGMNGNPVEQNQKLFIDSADYTVLSPERDALFIMTNSMQMNQEYKRCPESSVYKQATCTNDTKCQKLQGRDYGGGGKVTGRCLATIGMCEIQGWCPAMNDSEIGTPSLAILNFTILVKNRIIFPHYDVRRSNLMLDSKYLQKCNYHPAYDSECPVFRISTLLDLVERDSREQLMMLRYGGIIEINIDWTCNFDKPLTDCLPEYRFQRLDAPIEEESSSNGFNLRFVSQWKRGSQSFRTLTKAYGLRFFVSVNGYGSRFDITAFVFFMVLIIGASRLITFIFDIIGLHIYRRSAVDQSQISQN